MITLVQITKSEKEEIMKRYPDMKFVRTMISDSKRHHYYMVEQPGAMAMLRRIRGIEPERNTNNRRNNRNGQNRRGGNR